MLTVLWKIDDFIDFVFSAIQSGIQLILKVFRLIGNVLVQFGRILTSLPTIVYIAIFALLIVCVLYKVLGREGGGST